MQHTQAPLIELHGYTVPESKKIIEQVLGLLKGQIAKSTQEKLVFSVNTSRVFDLQENMRPFLRLYSSEYDIVHVIMATAKAKKFEVELEFIHISQYHDFRAKK